MGMTHGNEGFIEVLEIISRATVTFTSKNKRYNLPTFRQLHDAIIKVTNGNKINKCEIKSYNSVRFT